MALTPKNWQDLPSTATPISAAALEDLETRLGAYADSIAGSGGDPDAVQNAVYSAYGGLLSGSLTAGSPVVTALGNGGQFLQVNGLTSGGLDWVYGMQVFNIMDYGADSTGTTSSVDAINNCLDDAAGNGIAYFPEGVYRIDDHTVPVQIPDNTRMLGAGIGNTIIRAHTTFGNAAMVRRGMAASSVSNVTIEGIEFDGNKANRAAYVIEGASQLIGLSGASDANRSTNINFVNSAIVNSHGLGWAIKFGTRVTVMNSLFANNARDGVCINDACAKWIVANNHIYGSGDDHISAHSLPSATVSTAVRTYDGVISGNVIGLHGTTHAGHGITVSGVQNVTISGNSLRGGYLAGITAFNNSACPIEGLAIVGNVLHDSGSSDDGTFGSGIEGDGIRLDTIPNGQGYYGQLGTAPVLDVTISGNVVRGPWRHGIRLDGESATPKIRWASITGNMIVGAANTTNGRGVYLQKWVSDVVVANNLIRDFAAAGIECGTNVERVQFTGGRVENCCKSSGGAAIKLGAATDVTVGHGLRVLDNQGSPTQTAAIDWGTSTHPYVDGANFYLCSTGSTFIGTQPATAKLGSYVDRAGTLIGGGGSGAAADVPSVEDLFASHTAMSIFPSTTPGSVTTYPVFVAPVDCDVTAASLQIFNPDGGVVANDTNYYSVSIRRYRADTEVTLATKTTRATSPGAAIPDRRTEWNFEGVAWSNTAVLKGDVIGFRWETFGTPAQAVATSLVMTVKYEPA